MEVKIKVLQYKIRKTIKFIVNIKTKHSEQNEPHLSKSKMTQHRTNNTNVTEFALKNPKHGII